jgi:hypothetical protein
MSEIADRFASELETTFGSRIVSAFTYGAAMFPPAPVTDFDAHVVADRPLDPAAITALHERLGGDTDVWYITLDDAKGSDAPRDMRGVLRDEAWALHRAHIHAGRYKVIRGIDPREFVPNPTWDELDASLQHELAWLTERLGRHPEYCVLDLCRIACSYANRNVVYSKLDGALWALAALPDEHHATIRAALDGYRSRSFGEIDARGFHDVMRPKIEMLRA